MVQEKKRAKFVELSDSEKQIISRRCFLVALECEFRGSKIKEKYSFASSTFILDKAQYYADTYANEKEKAVYIKKKDEFEKKKASNAIYYRDDTKYQLYISQINEIDDMDKLHEYIKGNNPDKQEILISPLRTAVIDRARAIGDPIYFNVYNKLLAYGKYKYDKKSKINQDKSLQTLEANIEKAKDTLQDFLDSEFIHKQDYCESRDLSTNVFDKHLAIVRDYSKEFYDRFSTELEEKIKAYYESLGPVVEDIITNIKTNKNYTIIDYYLKYHDLYKFRDLEFACKSYNYDIRALKTFLSKADVKSFLKYDAFMKEKYTVFAHEFTDEEKQRIYDFTKENKIPFNWHNVSLIVMRHYKNANTQQINSKHA